ncbi:Gfo/Idh/MocA family oxidoreductase [Actinosynnema sp. NPDC023587]|uniref:Gfo/Idh/MocA family oxidoreductase n=1 Tax=Actinosynnema sp. NPDC023587 TaxID=3154695 RepID=UPI0033C34427
MKNVLVIGVGPHARRNHIPVLREGRSVGQVGAIVGVDVPAAAEAIAAFNAAFPADLVPVSYVEPFDPAARTVPGAVRAVLDGLVAAHRIDAVIVSTEPSFHVAYANWALDRELSLLIDKPPSVRVDCSTDPDRAAGMITDFEDLVHRYERVRRRNPGTFVGVQCQRRYHPAFRAMKRMVADVAELTNCPVTSVQSFHSDGQWRMPAELVDLEYHSFDRGYGKGAHSGYHFFDVVPWLLEAAETEGKELDEVEVYANVTRPADFLRQLDLADYERNFPGYARLNRYTEADLAAATASFGEVDAFISMGFKSAGRTMTLASVNLLHNGYSQRGWPVSDGVDLYKGNGRVRHETHIVEQGPFQAIHFHSLQSHDDGPDGGGSPGVGGRGHVEVHVFRNSAFHRRWTAFETLDYEALTDRSGSVAREPTQGSARRWAVAEFLEYLNGLRGRGEMSSELTTHRRGTTLMAGTYLSAARRWRGEHPVAALDFRARTAVDEPAVGVCG